MYSKQNRSLRCVYTENGRNIFYRFFVGLLWNTNGSEETHPPLSLAARKGVLWLCFGLLRLLYQPRVALYEFLVPLVLAHRLQKVFPMPMCHRSTEVCWFGNDGGARKAASARDALSSFAETRWASRPPGGYPWRTTTERATREGCTSPTSFSRREFK